MQSREHLKKTEHIEYGGRAVYGAMVAAMDEGIGRVLRQLDQLKLRERTLIFFFSDNGGRSEHAVNYPYRGHKGMLFEGGIRAPFCISWPARIPAGQTFDAPITGLDVFPTALAAAGVPTQKSVALDGVNLLPHLAAVKTALASRTHVWRYASGPGEFGYAVRDGDWKLVSSIYKGRKLLFNLATDPYEQHDVVAGHADIVRRLTATYDHWATQMMPPRWLDPHGENVRKEEAARQSAVEQASRGERKK